MREGNNFLIVLIILAISAGFYATLHFSSSSNESSESVEVDTYFTTSREYIDYNYRNIDVDVDKIVELTNSCKRYTDGCNTCSNGACTVKYCEVYAEPKCLD